MISGDIGEWAVLEALGVSLQSRLATRTKADRVELTRELERTFANMVTHLAPQAVLEIGAHGAEFARLMKTRLPAARVVAFEANPEVFAHFNDVCTRAQITYLHQCVSDTPGPVRLRVPVSRRDGEPRTRTGSILIDLSKRENKFRFVEHEVSSTTLDAYLAEDAGKASIALWIDVEGAVEAVLDGAAASLKACVAVYVEVGKQEHWRGQMLDRQVADRLAQHGLVPFLRDAPKDAPLAQYNALFLRRDALDDPALAALYEKHLRTLEAILERGPG